jgi:hypothetical protein
MATSLAFGILFATVIMLALIPTLYLIGDDITRLTQRLLGRRDPAGVQAPARG